MRIIEKIIRKIEADGMRDYQFGLQDPGSAVQEGIINFHHDLMIVLVFVVVFVGYMLGRILHYFEESKNKESDKVVHGTVIEIVWTIIPAIILIIISVPSFTLLYAIDEIVEPSITIKIIGHQWYWTYEYSDMEDIEFEYDSYMINEEDLEVGELRLLEVDNRIVLPVETHVRMIVTAADVLHSFAVPALGIKIDSVPGRLNEVSTYIKRPGVYYGQCSELCGVNHAFMPIGIEAISMEEYIEWIEELL